MHVSLLYFMLSLYDYPLLDLRQAEGTTLGADNGIGVAAALAVLDGPPGASLPPLECLFTVDEEVGMTGGAKSLWMDA